MLDINQYAVKYRILRQERDQRFLLEHAGLRPDGLGNRLLDVQLAYVEFNASIAPIGKAGGFSCLSEFA